MTIVTRLLRPARRHNPSSTATTTVTSLAAMLPVLALAGACIAGQARAEKNVIVDKPQQRGAADFNGCAKPAWPKGAREAKEGGTVTLAVLVGATGNVLDSQVRKSSGHPALDEAAREAIARCRFQAGRDRGEPVKSWVYLQYVWLPG